MKKKKKALEGFICTSLLAIRQHYQTASPTRLIY